MLIVVHSQPNRLIVHLPPIDSISMREAGIMHRLGDEWNIVVWWREVMIDPNMLTRLTRLTQMYIV